MMKLTAVRRQHAEAPINLTRVRRWHVDATITATQVAWVRGVRPRTVRGGAAITAGQVVYKNTATNEHELADADTDTASEVAGVAISDGQDGRDMLIAPPGAVYNCGFTTTAGTIYVLSTTAGGIAPEADLASGDYVVVLFVGNGTAIVELIAKKGTAVHA